ncbi:nuclear transport factor 2 family protein [Nibrella viscosa]
MDDQLKLLLEKDRIIDTINLLFIATDSRDWEAVKRCFTELVMFDMSSMTGAAPALTTAQEIAAGWEQGLAPLKAVHHQAGNYRVRIHGDQAEAFCYATATHFLPNSTGQNTRTFVGSYDFRLINEDKSWRINQFTFNLKYLDGNTDLHNPDSQTPNAR